MDIMLLPVLHTDLFAKSREAIDAIKTAAGLTDAQFAALCMPILRAYADHVQNLPLTITAFGSPRGAWEFGLTAAMVAYRYAGTVIFFPTLGSEERRLLEPQCRYMAFLASLATAVTTVAESSILISGDDEYHPLNVDSTLYAWLSEHRDVQFKWRAPATPLCAQAGAAIAAGFIPKRLLANFDMRVVLMMYEAINPKTTLNGVESTLAKVVRQAVQGVLDHYRTKQAGTFVAEPNQQIVSTVEAEMVAKKMINTANPARRANPLTVPAAEQYASASPETPPNRSEGLQQTHGELQQAMASFPSVTISAGISPPVQEGRNDAEEKLACGHKVLQEWFDALKQHPQFPALKDQLVMTAEGIEVPVSMLGMFGISGATIRKMLDDAGLILRRSDNARGVILHPGLRNRFIAQ